MNIVYNKAYKSPRRYNIHKPLCTQQNGYKICKLWTSTSIKRNWPSQREAWNTSPQKSTHREYSSFLCPSPLSRSPFSCFTKERLPNTNLQPSPLPSLVQLNNLGSIFLIHLFILHFKTIKKSYCHHLYITSRIQSLLTTATSRSTIIPPLYSFNSLLIWS